MLNKLRKHQFLFEELVKRDFKKRYKRTVLGMLWSMLAPLLQLLVMSLVFTRIFGRNTPHYTIYLFAGNLVFHFFKDSTNSGMSSLTANAGIISRVNVPKYLFLLSQNISSLINFLLTFLIFVLFVLLDGIRPQWSFILMLYPIGCLLVFNIGAGLILSALYIIFKDIKYLYDIFTLLLMYLSAIFYTVDRYPQPVQKFFYLNPVYAYIRYIRMIVIENRIPSLQIHGLCAFYALAVLLAGSWIYKRYNYKFLYYM